VKLAVADTGVGIPYEETARIFERFYRSDGSRSQPGNGLGLSLSLANARAHGGRISVESVPGRGSTFTLVLPRRPA
jgi:two-component system sensor histidine kinase MtrB